MALRRHGRINLVRWCYHAGLLVGPYEREVALHTETALLQEVISMFGPDGISLDFLRAPLFFNTSTTTGEERRSVMGAWVRDLRRRMSAGGVPTLSARIPPKLETLDAIGLDIRGLVADGTRRSDSRTSVILTYRLTYFT